jgi:hypothetical protein
MQVNKESWWNKQIMVVSFGIFSSPFCCLWKCRFCQQERSAWSLQGFEALGRTANVGPLRLYVGKSQRLLEFKFHDAWLRTLLLWYGGDIATMSISNKEKCLLELYLLTSKMSWYRTAINIWDWKSVLDEVTDVSNQLKLNANLGNWHDTGKVW